MWLLDRVVDAWGNYFDIHYNLDSGSNVASPNAFVASGVWVSEMDYTGSLAAPQAKTFNRITFGYLPQNRGDVHWTTLGPLKIPQVKLLQTITTPAGQYSLTYQGGSNGRFESLLDKNWLLCRRTVHAAPDFRLAESGRGTMAGGIRATSCRRQWSPRGRVSKAFSSPTSTATG